jgi:hypothetical protein
MMDELDERLLGDRGGVPRDDFAARVMTAVRREAAIPPPLPFPWGRMAPLLTLSAGSLAAAARLAPAGAWRPDPSDPAYALSFSLGSVVLGLFSLWASSRIGRLRA